METQTNQADIIQQQVNEKPEPSYWRILAVVFAIVFLVSLSLNILSMRAQKQQGVLQEPTQEPTSVSTPTSSLTEEPSPTKRPQPSLLSSPTPAIKPVTIPADWKSYTATDPDLGIKTTMSMPSGYSFRFTGSEFTIQNDSDATELWDYSTSVYRDNDGLKNHYSGGSRRTWYEDYLSTKQSAFQYKDKILNVAEVPINATSYLAIAVETPAYNDHGEVSGTKKGTHYVYVQNNILHMITPASIKAYTVDAQIPKNIGIIFVSLSSVQVK